MDNPVIPGVILMIYSFVIMVFMSTVISTVERSVLMTQENTGIFNKEKNTQLRQDWETRPFADIIVTEKESCPETHPDLVF